MHFMLFCTILYLSIFSLYPWFASLQWMPWFQIISICVDAASNELTRVHLKDVLVKKFGVTEMVVPWTPSSALVTQILPVNSVLTINHINCTCFIPTLLQSSYLIFCIWCSSFHPLTDTLDTWYKVHLVPLPPQPLKWLSGGSHCARVSGFFILTGAF